MLLFERLLLAFIVLAVYGLFCFAIWRRRSFQAGSITKETSALEETGDRFDVLVGYASQSGTAADLAEHTAQALTGQKRVLLLALNKIDAAILQRVEHALFVVSTYGEGEAPDNGARFAHRFLDHPPALDLSTLKFAVLALGDRSYRHFCGFGHRLSDGLTAMNARAMGTLIRAGEEDLQDESLPMRQWKHHLAALSHRPLDTPVNLSSSYQLWRLARRQLLNAGSTGAPLYHLQLTPLSHRPVNWQAGDIAEIIPRNSADKCRDFIRKAVTPETRINPEAWFTLPGAPHDEKVQLVEWLARRQLPTKAAQGTLNLDDVLRLPLLAKRDYSIASVPTSGFLDLVVRQEGSVRGTAGVCSGWLTADAAEGTEIELRIRPNPTFHGPELETDVILIGNGSGIAGLRAHLQAREKGAGRNWLIYGERSPACDRPFAEEINNWRQTGLLTRTDFAFSRDENSPAYVQDALLAAAIEVERWVAQGTAIYVCGSQSGMAEGVHTALETILGLEKVSEMRDSDRYRRDVY